MCLLNTWYARKEMLPWMNHVKGLSKLAFHFPSVSTHAKFDYNWHLHVRWHFPTLCNLYVNSTLRLRQTHYACRKSRTLFKKVFFVCDSLRQMYNHVFQRMPHARNSFLDRMTILFINVQQAFSFLSLLNMNYCSLERRHSYLVYENL